MNDETREMVLGMLAAGGGSIPCSRYGRRSDDLGEILCALVDIYLEANGPTDVAALAEGYISALVNDSDGPETMILEHGDWGTVGLLDYFDHDYVGSADTDEFVQGWCSAAVFADAYTADGEPSDVHPMDWNIGGVPTFGSRDFTEDSWGEITADCENVLDVLGAHGAAMVAHGAMSWRTLGENAWYSSHGHGAGFFECGHPWADRLQELARGIGASDRQVIVHETERMNELDRRSAGKTNRRVGL